VGKLIEEHGVNGTVRDSAAFTYTGELYMAPSIVWSLSFYQPHKARFVYGAPHWRLLIKLIPLDIFGHPYQYIRSANVP